MNSPLVARFMTVPLSVTSALTMKATRTDVLERRETENTRAIYFRPEINTTKHGGNQDRRSRRIRMPVPRTICNTTSNVTSGAN
jgi:hypothetical protein